MLRRLSLVALTAGVVLLAGCGVDAEVAEYCRVFEACECDGGDCCISKAGAACYEGQCCTGLTCQEGVCVPDAQ